MSVKSAETAGYRLRCFTDDVVFLAGFGEWTEEHIQRFCEELSTLAKDLKNKEWVLLGDVTDLVLEAPDLQEKFRTCTHKMIDKGCSSVAFYTGPGALKRLSFYRLMEPDSPSFHFRVYLTRQRAVAALRGQGFEVLPEDINSFFREEGISR